MFSIIFDKISRLSFDLYHYFSTRTEVPVVYFDGRKNVGDLVNSYLLDKMFGYKCYRAKTNLLPHLRIVGSVLGSASKNSFIFGGGSIDGRSDSIRLKGSRVFALRGKLSLDIVRECCASPSLSVPLGDPALLLPFFYNPKINRSVRVGLIPHFADKSEFINSFVRGNKDIELIDVEVEVEDFLDQLAGCEFVLSSSLHGLIIADAYGIPNKWLTLSSSVLGAGFKFRDYYSTTNSPCEIPVDVRSHDDMSVVIDKIEELCAVKEYNYDLSDLMSAIKKIPGAHERFKV